GCPSRIVTVSLFSHCTVAYDRSLYCTSKADSCHERHVLVLWHASLILFINIPMVAFYVFPTLLSDMEFIFNAVSVSIYVRNVDVYRLTTQVLSVYLYSFLFLPISF
ncbi:hypothetical protein T310_7361, partial [Rasamsonia emersonii CBS 393.64]